MTAHIAIVYDKEQRPDTTGTYCERALGAGLADVEYLPPSALADAKLNGFDFYLFVDDGLDYEIPEHLKPRAYWAIDTHLNFRRSLKRARGMDFVFAAQRDGVFDILK